MADLSFAAADDALSSEFTNLIFCGRVKHKRHIIEGRLNVSVM